jgi:hypothetical protein
VHIFKALYFSFYLLHNSKTTGSRTLLLSCTHNSLQNVYNLPGRLSKTSLLSLRLRKIEQNRLFRYFVSILVFILAMLDILTLLTLLLVLLMLLTVFYSMNNRLLPKHSSGIALKTSTHSAFAKVQTAWYITDSNHYTIHYRFHL